MDSLYSRQIGVFGKNAMTNITKLRILIIGCETIGIEAAKSLSLMGVNTIYLYDNTTYSAKHYGRLIIKTDRHPKLSILGKEFIDNLQSGCNVGILNNSNEIESLLKNNKVDVMIATDTKFKLIELEKICKKYQKPFIFGCNNELLGYIFVNFGKWTVSDRDGEPPFKNYIQKHTTKDDFIYLEFESSDLPISNSFIISTNKKTCKGDAISFKIEKHGVKKYVIAKIKKTKKILNILKLSNLIYTETKKSITIKQVDYIKKIKTADYQYIDTDNSFKRNDELYSKYTKFILTDKPVDYPDYELKLDSKFYIMGTIIGGILAQESLKAVHKYTPLHQEIFFNFRNLYGDIFYKNSNKFKDMTQLFDKKLIQKLKKLKMFMVGCGALGCENAKNLGMLGFCQSKKSKFGITDMDNIELSNLTRQFLFQPNDIGEFKSLVVKKKLSSYCPDINIESYNEKICTENEEMFNYSFWNNYDIIINALDNVEARKYVDSKCVCFKKPLFESGTLGIKGNTQVIIPNKTATYSEINDPPERGIPMCTIRNFPNNIEHCVEWGLSIFDKIFHQGFMDLNKLQNNKQDLLKEINMLDNKENIQERYAVVYHLSMYYLNKNINNLVELGNYIYNNYYYNVIDELLQTHTDDEFWTGNKLKPILKKPSGILNKKYYLSILNIIDKENNELRNIELVNIKQTIVDYKSIIQTVDLEKETIIPIDLIYDKDNALHLDMMTKLVNLRAKCYNIKEEEDITIQLLSGRVIPALSTTTSIVSGFLILDIIKYLAGLNVYSETNINIGINSYTRYKAFRPKVTYNNMFHKDYGIEIKTVPEHFNTWSMLEINGHKNSIKTNIDLCKYLKHNLNILNIDMLILENFIVYSKEKNNSINLKKLYSLMSNKKGFNVSKKEPLIIEIISFTNEFVPVLTPIIKLTLL